MKIYSIAMFLVMVNLSITYLVAADVLPVAVETLPISETDFKTNVPDELTYSNADIGLYLFGDFPRALGMLAKIFIFAPNSLSLLLGAAGFPSALVSIFTICTWMVYLSGLAQIIMKFGLESSS